MAKNAVFCSLSNIVISCLALVYTTKNSIGLSSLRNLDAHL